MSVLRPGGADDPAWIEAELRGEAPNPVLRSLLDRLQTPAAA